MFDFHMHSLVSFDGRDTAVKMAQAAQAAGLREICFTDHLDYDPLEPQLQLAFDTQTYNDTYDFLELPGLSIRRGAEFGLLRQDTATPQRDISRRQFDFIIGSVHFVEDLDVYFAPYWQNKTVEQAERLYLEEVLACVTVHEHFDVLGHLTYISKARCNPTHRPILYEDYRELVDEIFRQLIKKDKGLEINTSGLERSGVFLPTADYLRRFKALGGRIVTVGSDAHDARRVGENCSEAVQMAADIFGYVCTFADRKPIFHKI